MTARIEAIRQRRAEREIAAQLRELQPGPIISMPTVASWQPQMTMRDQFAAKALPSIYSDAMAEAADGSGLFSDPDWRMGLALDAYAMADAMLKAREA